MVGPINNNLPLAKNNKPLTPEQLQLKKACDDFETIMARQLLDVAQGDTKLFGKGFGGDFFQGMFNDEMAKQVTGNGLGLSKMLYEQLSKTSSSK